MKCPMQKNTTSLKQQRQLGHVVHSDISAVTQLETARIIPIGPTCWTERGQVTWPIPDGEYVRIQPVSAIFRDRKFYQLQGVRVTSANIISFNNILQHDYSWWRPIIEIRKACQCRTSRRLPRLFPEVHDG